MAPFFYAHILLQVCTQAHSEADSDAIMGKSAPAGSSPDDDDWDKMELYAKELNRMKYQAL